MKLILVISSLLTAMGLGLWGSTIVELDYPSYFPEPIYNFDENPLDEKKIELGRALFYDPILSLDNTISCASCHSPYNSFAHTDHALSHGIKDSIGNRNAPALINLAWSENFMWDGAVHHLDMQALAPIEDEKEMGLNFSKAIEKLQVSQLYQSLFLEAYQDSLITGERTLKALAQFQLTLVSGQAKYDKINKGEASFTPQEQDGYLVFFRHCQSCHQEPLFTNGYFANNGLLIDSSLMDLGRADITKRFEDRGKFKIPTLRNLDYTYPYMHDGRFRNLSEVIDFYRFGTKNTGVDDRIGEAITMSSKEKVDLMAFLLCLNDKEFVFDKKHHFPREILRNLKNE